METAFVVVWGIALLVIAILGAILAFTLRRFSAGRTAQKGRDAAFAPAQDILLFEYDKNILLSAIDGHVLVRIKGISWDAAWQNDLLRVQVNAQDPRQIALDPAQRDARILAAYQLSAFRMTDLGADVTVERFVKPIDIVLTSDEPDGELGVFVQQDAGWQAAPQPATPVEEIERRVGKGRRWAAASIAKLAPVCLVQIAPPETEPRSPAASS